MYLTLNEYILATFNITYSHIATSGSNSGHAAGILLRPRDFDVREGVAGSGSSAPGVLRHPCRADIRAVLATRQSLTHEKRYSLATHASGRSLM